jgi:hypothetical protein
VSALTPLGFEPYDSNKAASNRARNGFAAQANKNRFRFLADSDNETPVSCCGFYDFLS